MVDWTNILFNAPNDVPSIYLPESNCFGYRNRLGGYIVNSDDIVDDECFILYPRIYESSQQLFKQIFSDNNILMPHRSQLIIYSIHKALFNKKYFDNKILIRVKEILDGEYIGRTALFKWIQIFPNIDRIKKYIYFYDNQYLYVKIVLETPLMEKMVYKTLIVFQLPSESRRNRKMTYNEYCRIRTVFYKNLNKIAYRTPIGWILYNNSNYTLIKKLEKILSQLKEPYIFQHFKIQIPQKILKQWILNQINIHTSQLYKMKPDGQPYKTKKQIIQKLQQEYQQV